MRSYQRLAAAGIEYTEHFTSSPWTLPSIASLMTGLPPDQHRAGLSLSTHALLAKTPVPAGLPSLPRTLGTNGYRTHAIVTNPFLTSWYGVDEGFCSFENVTMGGELVRGLAHTTPMRLARILAPRARLAHNASGANLVGSPLPVTARSSCGSTSSTRTHPTATATGTRPA